MPFILLSLVIAFICFNGVIPIEAKSFLYALSLSLKSLLLFCLPFLIFMLLFKTMAQLSRGATKLILLIVSAVCCSNFISTMISYPIGSLIYRMDLSLSLPESSSALTPSWVFSLPKLIPNDLALFSGILLGIFFSLFAPKIANRIAPIFERLVTVIFRFFIYIIPLFISGFAIKLAHEKTLGTILQNYALVFLMIFLSLFLYISFLYLFANRFRFSDALQSAKNMTPAAIAGFSTMSSVAAMPLTLNGCEKNAPPELARLSVPVTVNTHLIGDCFAIPILAFAMIKSFGAADPSFVSYLLFAFYFVLAKFSVASVPGGGVLVMLPVLETQLGFTPEMSSLMTAVYILFDPLITTANIFGNGGFVLVLKRAFRASFGRA